MPADFPLTNRSLVRVFLRPKATLPRTLQRRLASLPMCVSIAAPQGGKNAADFVMSMHAGLLHASLPMHIPFTLITNDKALSAIVQELQRVGRVAELWSSHPARAAAPAPGRVASATTGRSRRSGGGRSRRARPAAAAPVAAESAPLAASEPASPARPSRSLADVAAAYAKMLSRIKDPPSRLKALLNDISNRTANFGIPAADILEELKRSHGLRIDERGRVSRG
jgi:hypothetical protein